MVSSSHDVTRLLDALGAGDRSAFDTLLPLVYDELRSIAQRHLYRERGDHTLSTTALVHEAYLRLVDGSGLRIEGRAHFFAIAAIAMRRILVDYARARNAAKRGSGQAPLGLDAAQHLSETRADELVVLDAALERLARLNERQARVVECRYFAGLTVEETAEGLGISATTVKQDWAVARAWLYREMQRELSP